MNDYHPGTHTNNLILKIPVSLPQTGESIVISDYVFYPKGRGLDLKQKCHAPHGPSSGFLLGFQVEGPDESGASCLCLVDWTLIDVSRILPVDWYSLYEHDRHGRS